MPGWMFAVTRRPMLGALVLLAATAGSIGASFAAPRAPFSREAAGRLTPVACTDEESDAAKNWPTASSSSARRYYGAVLRRYYGGYYGDSAFNSARTRDVVNLVHCHRNSCHRNSSFWYGV
jgi:hypothetical protein